MASLFALALAVISCQGGFTRVTVPDCSGKLIWQAKDGGEMTWKRASHYCHDLDLDGKDDWRLPEMEELEAAYPIKSEFAPPVSGSFWTSTTSSRFKAGYVKFDFGVTGYRKKIYPAFVRCIQQLN